MSVIVKVGNRGLSHYHHEAAESHDDGCGVVENKEPKNERMAWFWFGTRCSALNAPGWMYLEGCFVLGGLAVSRGRVCAADTNKVGDSIWSNLTAPAGEEARGTANTAQPDSQPTCKSSQWAPGRSQVWGKGVVACGPRRDASRFGSRFEYVWPSSAVLCPSRVLATWRPSRPLDLMAFRNRLSLKEGSFWSGFLCRSSLHTYIHVETYTTQRDMVVLYLMYIGRSARLTQRGSLI